MIWTDMQPCSFFLYTLHAAVLLYGGITDLRRREIPNLVPIVLILSSATQLKIIIFRLTCMLAMACIFFLASAVSKTEVPGGDIKLLCALTFSSSLSMTAITLLLSEAGSVIIGAIEKKPFRRNIPLCTYVAPAYALTYSLFFREFAYFSSFLLICVVLLWLTKGENNRNTSKNNKEDSK